MFEVREENERRPRERENADRHGVTTLEAARKVNGSISATLCGSWIVKVRIDSERKGGRRGE